MTQYSAGLVRRKTDEQKAVVDGLFEALAKCSLAGSGITRDTYGPGEDCAHRVIAKHALDLGLEVRVDAAANTYVTLPGKHRDRPKVIIGSHLDSVPNGGNFDGAAGVVAGLTSLAVLSSLGFEPECDVTIMGVRAEESVWFQVSYIGSRSALGSLPANAMQMRRIDTKRTLESHIRDSGGDPDAIVDGKIELDPAQVRAFLELHIEQAPSLVEAGVPVAVGAGIPGNFRYASARVLGRYDHVGT
ncbi:M20/M25/M40 family metallo-hydrolase, partial [Mesorhizobium sp. M7D.F.Ca.US.004.03.1.1]|uniref:M20/M25/M40 family metallo-hydrolase n=1 Tax=Mesorhizobium sp. M7D.F.Ca.US.004.03.1.1 TaxID=2496702 RepID=UPI0013E29D55